MLFNRQKLLKLFVKTYLMSYEPKGILNNKNCTTFRWKPSSDSIIYISYLPKTLMV